MTEAESRKREKVKLLPVYSESTPDPLDVPGWFAAASQSIASAEGELRACGPSKEAAQQ